MTSCRKKRQIPLTCWFGTKAGVVNSKFSLIHATPLAFLQQDLAALDLDRRRLRLAVAMDQELDETGRGSLRKRCPARRCEPWRSPARNDEPGPLPARPRPAVPRGRLRRSAGRCRTFRACPACPCRTGSGGCRTAKGWADSWTAGRRTWRESPPRPDSPRTALPDAQHRGGRVVIKRPEVELQLGGPRLPNTLRRAPFPRRRRKERTAPADAGE